MSQPAPNFVPDRGDVVKVPLDPTRGHEQSGSRPALVLSPQEYNRRTGMAVVCSVTNKGKGYPFEVQIPPGLAVTGVILSDQIRSLDWVARQATHFATLDEETVNQVVGLILSLIDPGGVFGANE